VHASERVRHMHPNQRPQAQGLFNTLELFYMEEGASVCASGMSEIDRNLRTRATAHGMDARPNMLERIFIPASGSRSFGRSPRPSLPRFSCTLSGSTASTSRTSGLRTCWPLLHPRLKAPDSGLAFTPVHADQPPSGWTPCPPPSL
jgi:hypothetical protein